MITELHMATTTKFSDLWYDSDAIVHFLSSSLFSLYNDNSDARRVQTHSHVRRKRVMGTQILLQKKESNMISRNKNRKGKRSCKSKKLAEATG
ncbi:hypothetical protein F0562_004759 [Nyssa sinensis]|uniref:Uncharacterized protein n=1 Tax=Nyssa sinensis TaxID=561372 RepID=A0A5J5AHJ1_9ASTE|nr:hypothetical protein F0562_004759 [Nyssa sinensis]